LHFEICQLHFEICQLHFDMYVSSGNIVDGINACERVRKSRDVDTNEDTSEIYVKVSDSSRPSLHD